MYGGMAWWMLFGGVIFVLFWVLVITLIVWVVRKIGQSSRTQSAHNALEIAKERYARGDITKEQFEQIKKDLSN